MDTSNYRLLANGHWIFRSRLFSKSFFLAVICVIFPVWAFDTDRDGFEDENDTVPNSRVVADFLQMATGDQVLPSSPVWLQAFSVEGGRLSVGQGWCFEGSPGEGVFFQIDRTLQNAPLTLTLLPGSVGAVGGFQFLLVDDTLNVLFTFDVSEDRVVVPLGEYPAATWLQLVPEAESSGVLQMLSLYVDEDGDGLDADQEAQLGTSDQNTDSDGDGFSDRFEWLMGSDPLDAESVPAVPLLIPPPDVFVKEVTQPLPLVRDFFDAVPRPEVWANAGVSALAFSDVLTIPVSLRRFSVRVNGSDLIDPLAGVRGEGENRAILPVASTVPFSTSMHFSAKRVTLDGSENRLEGGPVTISAWVKPYKRKDIQVIVTGSYVSGAVKRDLVLRMSGINYQFGTWHPSTDKELLASFPSPADDLNTWIHLAGTFDGQTYRLYRNGEPVASCETTHIPPAFNAPWRLGGHATSDGRSFWGEMGEITFWQGALEPEVVHSLYVLGRRGVGAGSLIAACMRTWSASDEQGQSASAVQMLLGIDFTPPELIVPPRRVIPLPCDDFSTATHGVAHAFDTVTLSPGIAFSDSPITFVQYGAEQVQSFERTWTAWDAAGLKTEKVQHFLLTDGSAPVLTLPPDITLQAPQNIFPEMTGWATAIDNADPDPVISWEDRSDTALGVLLAFTQQESVIYNGTTSTGRILTDDALQDLDISRPFTVAAWVLPNVWNNYHPIFNYRSSNAATGEVALRIEHGSYCFGWSRGKAYLAKFPIPAEDRNRRVHLAGRFTGTAFELYRNGICVAKASIAVPVVNNSAARWAIARNAIDHTIVFKGSIARAAIWSRALTARELGVLSSDFALKGAHPLRRPAESDSRVIERLWQASDSSLNISSGVQMITVEGAYEDPDEDGLCNYLEEAYGTDPLDPDTDGDGLGDAEETLIYGSDPTNPDSDGDLLPDGWEVRYGFNPIVPGETYEDPDRDGLVNIAEFRAGTDPLNPDTDGDGVCDGVEVLSARTDPLKSDFAGTTFITQGHVVAGHTFVLSTGNWTRAGEAVYARERSGSLTYALDVPSPPPHALGIMLTQHNALTGQSCFDLALYVDGLYITRLLVYAPHGTTTEALFFLPELESGAHTFRLVWTNYEPNTFLEVQSLRFVSVEGTDAWLENREASLGSFVTQVGGYVSPLCVEGSGAWRDVLEIVISPEAGESFSLPVIPTIGEGFFIDVPLPDDGTPVVLALNDSHNSHAFSAAWDAFDLFAVASEQALESEPDTFTLRAGDALRLAGWANARTDVTISRAEDQSWIAVTNLTLTVPEPYRFEVPGEYLIDAETEIGGVQTQAYVRVSAVQSRFPSACPAIALGSIRELACPGLDPSAVLAHDADLDVRAEPCETGGVTLTMLARQDRTHGVLSRLSDEGPVLDAVQVVPIWADNGEYYRVLTTYADGSQLTEVVLQLGALPEGVTVRIAIFVAGVSFADGTRVKTLTASDFDENGTCRLLFLRAAGVKTSICHSTAIYQNGMLLYRNR